MALSHLSHDRGPKPKNMQVVMIKKDKKSSKSSQWRRRNQRIVGIL